MMSQYVTSEHEALEFGKLILQHYYCEKKMEKVFLKYERTVGTKLYCLLFCHHLQVLP